MNFIPENKPKVTNKVTTKTKPSQPQLVKKVFRGS